MQQNSNDIDEPKLENINLVGPRRYRGKKLPGYVSVRAKPTEYKPILDDSKRAPINTVTVRDTDTSGADDAELMPRATGHILFADTVYTLCVGQPPISPIKTDQYQERPRHMKPLPLTKVKLISKV